MNGKELQKRTEKAQNLRAINVAEGVFYVESSSGQVAYKLTQNNGALRCSCQDYQKNISSNPHFKCKHILALENSLPNGQVEKQDFLARRLPKLDERFVKTIEGKEFVLYAGLLDLAHQKGLLRIETEILQFPASENNQTAIVKAVAESKLGEVFADVGDANATNCNYKVGKHLVRMASTRAKARALRDFTNIGITALEELGDLNEVIEDGSPSIRANNHTNVAQKTKPEASGNNRKTQTKSETEGKPAAKRNTKAPQVAVETKTPSTTAAPDNQPRMSEAQKRAVYNLSKRRGIAVEELNRMAQEAFGVNLEYISASDAADFIRLLQQAA